jgi:hypothetical protein
MVIKYRKLGNKSDIAIFLDKKKLKYYLGGLPDGLGRDVVARSKTSRQRG